MKVEFYKHNVEEEDITRAIEVLRSPWLTTGKVVEEFEAKLAKYLGVDYVIAVSSGTAALHLSLLALGIGPGDEVITTPMTFVATSNAVIYTGAKPIFADVNKKDGLIDGEQILKALSSRTKALLPVHLYGQMRDMNFMTKIAQTGDPKLKVLEDAAHSLEATQNTTRPGSISSGACFSFYPIKSITSGEGGAFATNLKELADKVRLMRNHGMTKSASERYSKLYQHWDAEILGFNYRITDFQAALLLGQLDRVEVFRRKRSDIDIKYRNNFERNPKIQLLERDLGSACLMFTILVENRDEVLHKLQEKEIGVAVNYRPVHLLDYYRKTFGCKEGDFPNAEYIGARTITLPLYPKLKDSEVEYIIESAEEVVK